MQSERVKAFAVTIAGCLAALGCSSEREAMTNFHLATVAVAPQKGLVFIAKPGHGPVDVLQLPGAGDSSGLRFVARLSDPQRRHVIRLAVDDVHGRLWVADARVLQAYEVTNLKELRKYLAPSGYPERFSDVALDFRGNVFVLARGGARIYRIDSASLEMETWLDVSRQASDAAVALANRVLVSRDGKHLVMASPSRDELLRIDLGSKAIERLALTPDAQLTCGILLRRQGSSTIRAFDCAGDWEADITPAEDFRATSVHFRGRARHRRSVLSVQ